MDISVCHYSYHRLWGKEKLACRDLAKLVHHLEVPGIDFHAGLLGSVDESAEWIRDALKETGLVLSALALSNDFSKENTEELQHQIAESIRWLQVAADVEAPVARVFGGSVGDRSDGKKLGEAFNRVIESLGALVKEAERYGVVLALENHGGLPCSAEEQVDIIRKINSTHLRATVDIGNYLSCGQEPETGAAIAGPYAAYVHVKDFRKKKSTKNPWGWEPEAATVGQGEVDLAACFRELKKIGYSGFAAIEYEADAEERSAVPESVEHVKRILREIA